MRIMRTGYGPYTLGNMKPGDTKVVPIMFAVRKLKQMEEKKKKEEEVEDDKAKKTDSIVDKYKKVIAYGSTVEEKARGTEQGHKDENNNISRPTKFKDIKKMWKGSRK